MPALSASGLDEEPVILDEARLVEYILEADIPSLIAAVAEATGDTELLKQAYRPPFTVTAAGFAPQGGMESEAQLAAAHDLAPRILRMVASRAEALPGDSETPHESRNLIEIIEFLTGSTDDDYLDLLQNEIGIATATPKLAETLAHVPDYRVAIIGAGISGMAAAKRLRDEGIAYEMFERNPAVGGVWHENRYPGCRLDTFNFAYTLSFAQRNDWPDFYSERDAVYGYLGDVAEEFGMPAVTHFETEVLRATYDEERCVWHLTYREGGQVRSRTFNSVITATGHLNRPKYPAIPGRETFAGEMCHTARWPEDLQLDGKRVAVIGTGASAYQVVPSIVDSVSELLIFQRSAPWMIPSPDYHKRLSTGFRWLLDHLPNYHRWYRFWQFWMSTEGRFSYVQRDPSWKHEVSVSAENEALRKVLVQHIASQYTGNPELARKATPTYPPSAKRMLRDNGVWAAALKRPETQLITDAIVEITENGIVTASGAHHQVDVIVYATGFEAAEYLEPITFIGAQDTDLHEFWDGDPKAHVTATVPGFPNLFMVGGPNTSLVAIGSATFMAECAAEYVVQCIRYMIANGYDAMAPKSVPFEQYNEALDEANLHRAWGTPGVDTWYKNRRGRVSQVWPNRLLEFWKLTRGPVESDYDFFQASTDQAEISA